MPFKPAKFVVRCDIHGKRNSDNVCELGVPKPKTRKERVAGCPICAQNLKNKEKANE